MYLFFDTINIVIHDDFLNGPMERIKHEEWHHVLINRIDFNLVLSCFSSNVFEFQFTTLINDFLLFVVKPEVGYYYQIVDREFQFYINRKYRENKWIITIDVSKYGRNFTIHTLEPPKDVILILKIKSLLNDLQDKRLRKFY